MSNEEAPRPVGARAAAQRAEGLKASPSRTSGYPDVLFPLIYAVLYSGVALVIHARFFPVGDTGVEADFYHTLAAAARDLWNGTLTVANHPYKGPLYSFALAFVHRFGGDWYTNAVVLNALCGGAGIIVVYRLILRLFNRWTAVAATLSFSLVAEFFVHVHKASTDLLFFLLCLLAISLLLVTRPRWSALVGSAVTAALAFLTRYNGAFLAAVSIVVILFLDTWKLDGRRRLVRALVYALIFLAVCAPWFALNVAETGALLKTDNLRNVTLEFYPGRVPDGVSKGDASVLRALVAEDPGAFVLHYFSNIPRHLWRDVTGTIGLPVGVLMLLGAAMLLLAPPGRRQGSLYLFGAVYFLAMCSVFWRPRFAFPLLPVYATLGFSLLFGPASERRTRLGIAVGERFFEVHARLTERRSRAVRTAVVLVVGAILASQVAGIVRSERFYFDRRPLFVLRAADILRRHAEETRKPGRLTVMARKGHIPYYAGMDYRQYPKTVSGSRAVVAAAVERGADYVVFSELERVYYPRAQWVEGLGGELGVELIHSDRQVNLYALSPWLDLDSAAGQEELARRVGLLESLELEGDGLEAVRASAELYLLHMYNGDIDGAASYLARGIDAAGRLAGSDESEAALNALRNELMLLAHAYFDRGEQARGASLLRSAAGLGQ